MSDKANKITNLYSNPFPSTRSGALFNTFSYPTKISPESEALFIACHTKIGDTILDPFGGSGTTGVATMLCDKPTDEMKRLAAKYELNPQWGPRTAFVYEISTSGCMLGDVLCHTKHDVFEREARRLLDKCAQAARYLYETIDDKGEIGQIRHVIWSDVLSCPHCGSEIKYAEIAVTDNPLTFSDKGVCPHCGKRVSVPDLAHVKEKRYDHVLKKEITVKKRVPYKIYGITGRKKWCRLAVDSDLERFNLIEQSADYSHIPCHKIKWGELYRQGYHFGITHLHHFYTTRNAVMFSLLWSKIAECEESIKDALKIFLLSYNSSHSTLMTRVVAKKNSKDFILTGAQPGVLYISSLPVEKNIFLGLERKLKTFVDAFSLIDNSRSKAFFINESSTLMSNLSKASIDYVFTDPPFGDFIPYSEINQINECWLDNLTNSSSEVIINESQGKSLDKYAELMNSVFRRVSESLTNTGLCTLVFHSAKAEIWRAIIRAYKNAGFNVTCASILDKVQKTFKQTNSNVTVKGDPIILLNKTQDNIKEPVYSDDKDIAIALLDEVKKRKIDKEIATRLYSRYIIGCIENGLPVTLDAKFFFNSETDK